MPSVPLHWARLGRRGRTAEQPLHHAQRPICAQPIPVDAELLQCFRTGHAPPPGRCCATITTPWPPSFSRYLASVVLGGVYSFCSYPEHPPCPCVRPGATRAPLRCKPREARLVWNCGQSRAGCSTKVDAGACFEILRPSAGSTISGLFTEGLTFCGGWGAKVHASHRALAGAHFSAFRRRFPNITQSFP